MATIIELDGVAPSIGEGVFLAPTAVLAGAVLPERIEVAPGVLAAGVPAQEKKRLSGSAQRWTRDAADEYEQFRQRYTTASRVRDTGEARVA